ncbi:MAG: hypothetical protein LPK45_07600, partial [Bacteroidota bacterium]|nr:hypothetical protein [Bacteroidota bacterium]MDX5430937.1 hypothetical protein [Bacteroidota bacterium]MDX5469685.1 hypothetical protein [Bacteroidota bacterium]
MKRLILFSLILLMGRSLMAQKTIVVDDQSTFSAKGDYFSIVDDKDKSLTAAEAYLAKGTMIDRDVPNLNFAEGYFWLKSRVKNETHSPLRLHVNQPILDEVSLYIFQNGQCIDSVHYGESKAFTEREVKDPYFIFSLPIQYGEEADVLVRIASEEQIVLPVYVATS